jgi:hypothetical protein
VVRRIEMVGTVKRTLVLLGVLSALLLTAGCLQHRAGLRTDTPAREDSAAVAAAMKRLGIPGQGTVLALPGADLHLLNNMDDEFQGIFSRPPYTMRVIDYPRDLARDSIPTGVANLDAAIRSTSGTMIVLAYSQGAQVASEWMRRHAKDPSAPGPDRLTFVLFGNPLRASGGVEVGHPTDRSTGLATPTDTPWHIVDIARRYDGFADSPTDKSNSEAVRNADLGKLFIHTHYERVDLADSSLVVWNRGNTTFVLTQESPPLLGRRPANPGQADAMRADIESAYQRR